MNKYVCILNKRIYNEVWCWGTGIVHGVWRIDCPETSGNQPRRVTSQKSEDLNYTGMEAWNLACLVLSK